MPFSLLQTKRLRTCGSASGVGVALGRCGSWMTLTRPFHFPFTTQPCLSSCNRVCICICTSSRHGYCPIPRPTGSPRALLTATCILFDCPYLSIVKRRFSWHARDVRILSAHCQARISPLACLDANLACGRASSHHLISPKRTCPISPS
ncbi:hypothetical protein CI102_2311 [Trichoderma harzianum]|uniref:Uncharacterized protein n=1 Tax=Trichoderma harzianum CBS 226.95 TaxID=983964 RepID=A0A2T4A3K4_TRIHA|nr:hypothetical protein M431DRAFT_224615 [Trichoderma harzianum CBS 226.95]PKK51932.1 hypothetical protein CI102_2311 [Trichoderma harzianum]PTB51655.1 hypothetical protein M431DRAFT_224615 [Trichoderma harzianum CBS 226.95]